MGERPLVLNRTAVGKRGIAPLLVVSELDEARETLLRRCARRPTHGLRTEGRRYEVSLLRHFGHKAEFKRVIFENHLKARRGRA